ncbi:MAG: hypothetical protein L3J04_05525 [Robiginitomaculum sp.]|nr:hypothetical protein [Robiginitomaculum sp.]
MDNEYSSLLDEIPHLLRAKAFADSLSATPLFSRIGIQLDDTDRELATLYAQNLGFSHVFPARLLHLSEAIGAAEANDYDPEAWGCEEQLRASLHGQALLSTSEEGASALLQLVASEVSQIAKDSAEETFSHSSQVNEAAINCIIGHVAQSAHCMTLAILSNTDIDDPDHPFILRWSLFNRGRWPVGIIGSSYNLY